MPSTPPPLPLSSSRLISWSASQSSRSRSGEPNRTEECRSARGTCSPSWMNWQAILASVSVSSVLIVGVLAWIVTHPHTPNPPLQTISMVPADSSAEPVPSPPMPPISATPAFHRSHHLDAIAKNIPLIEEEPPPLPSPSSPQPRQLPRADLAKAPSQPAGETYGTRVLFHNNQAAAADLARQEHKLLFVMHISGNFEDSCFT